MTTAKIDYVIDLEEERNDHNDHNNNVDDKNNHTTSTIENISTIAFGSCHKNKYMNPIVWDHIRYNTTKLVAYLWVGDAIYPPVRDIASIQQLQYEYFQLKYNVTIGYHQLLVGSDTDTSSRNNNSTKKKMTTTTQQQHQKVHIFGTWDDHDYGGNDRGNDMINKDERAALFYQFINQTIPTNNDSTMDTNTNNNNHTTTINTTKTSSSSSSTNTTSRKGVYYSVDFRRRRPQRNDNTNTNTTTTIRILFLDTRYYRSEHCIPSIAGRLPLGAGIACLTRFISSGILQNYCTNKYQQQNATILGIEQWDWLHEQIYHPIIQPDILIVVSSIQVYTTNVVMESWGHYPNELYQLHTLLQYAAQYSTVTILSGDVHYGEILNPILYHHPYHNNNNDKYVSNTIKLPSEQQQLQQSEPPPYLEVTSSGLTHDCSKHIYGLLCRPLLHIYHLHRYISPSSSSTTTTSKKDNYYIGKNYGTIQMNWDTSTITINVHDAMNGSVVLTTGPRSFGKRNTTLSSLWNNSNTSTHEFYYPNTVMNNHLVPYIYPTLFILVVLQSLISMIMIFIIRYITFQRRRRRQHHTTKKTATTGKREKRD